VVLTHCASPRLQPRRLESTGPAFPPMLMFHMFSVLCCIHVASVLCCSTRGEPGAGRWGMRHAGGPTDRGAAGRGAQGACSSSAAHLDSRVSPVWRVEERDEGSGEGPTSAETGAKRTREQGKGGWGRAAWASDARVRPDVRVLVTPLYFIFPSFSPIAIPIYLLFIFPKPLCSEMLLINSNAGMVKFS
jgi:hypothetical protein